jgi:hypothetical protein
MNNSNLSFFLWGDKMEYPTSIKADLEVIKTALLGKRHQGGIVADFAKIKLRMSVARYVIVVISSALTFYALTQIAALI